MGGKWFVEFIFLSFFFSRYLFVKKKKNRNKQDTRNKKQKKEARYKKQKKKQDTRYKKQTKNNK
jgi:hypothetical protein